MLAFLGPQLATALVGLLVFGALVLVILKMIRDHRAGKHSCGSCSSCGGCGGCSGCGAGTCHCDGSHTKQ